jgi:16S rRNA A1518/A1519 N6-dimethyltransferase RsmA/KsgA/DIM1 with predicted DNA glycosylase/AP lyase activity
MTTQMELFEVSSPFYARAFELLVRCCDERTVIRAFLAQQIHALSPPLTGEDWAIDWGAGTGTLTQELVRHFRRVAAVEPLAEFRAQLHQACPTADVYAGTLLTPQFPADHGLARFSVCAHVLYHIAEED